MKQEIDQINQYLNESESVVVEAAHIYADREPGQEQQTGALLAARISAGLKPGVVRTLLIDDYNVNGKSLDVKAYLSWLADFGYNPDHVFMESDLVSDAHELIKELKEKIPSKKLWAPRNDPWKQNHGLAFWTKHDKVFLVTSQNRPSCPVLDTALYFRKRKLGGEALTILPETYLPQQRAVKAIMEKLERQVPIVNLYFGPNGRIVTA